jgi:predicted dehydrogenase
VAAARSAHAGPAKARAGVGMSRRRFLAALGAAPLARSFAQGPPSDAVRIGVIGFGVQGLTDANSALRVPNVKVVAAASCYDGHLERAKELLGSEALLTKDHRRILDRSDVDAVIVSTPDHWHAPICHDALAAGKHVYCEKPLTHTVEEGDALVKAAHKSGRVFQVGSQHTSSPHILEARQLIKDGALGQVTQIKASWDENNEISAWSYPIPPDASEKTVDWPRFQGNAPKRAFDPHRAFRWRTFRDYGEGLSGDVLVHIITTLHFLLDLDVPTVATAVGGQFRWKDGRDVYDTITGGWEYPEGIVAVLGAQQNNGYDGTQIRIMGSKATLVLTFASYTLFEETGQPNWRYSTNPWPKGYREEFFKSKGLPLEVDPAQPPRPQARTKEIRKWEPPEGGRRAAYHMQHFVDCIRGGKKPAQDVVMGNNAAVTAHMANLAYYEKKVVKFDRKTRKVG